MRTDHPLPRSERLASAFREHASELRRHALRLGASAEAAEDAVADAFVSVAKYDEARLQGIGNLRAYLYTATSSNVKRLLEHRARVITAPADDLDSPQPDFADDAPIGASVALARRALDSLPERDRYLLHQALVEDRNPRDLAPELGLTATHVRTLIHRARTALRVAYVREFIALTPPSCGVELDLLAQVVTETAGSRALSAYRDHTRSCSECPGIERSARAELLAGSLLPIAIVIALAAAEPPASAAAAAAAANPPSSDDAGKVGAAVAVAGVGLALLQIAFLLPTPPPPPPDAAMSDSALAVTDIATATVDIHAEPPFAMLRMPAPSERATWTTVVTNDSTTPVDLFTSVSADPQPEQPEVTVTRDGATAIARITPPDSPGVVALGVLAAKTSTTLTVTAARSADDVLDELSMNLDVRIAAATARGGATAFGAATTDVRFGRDALAPTGGDISAAAALAAAGVVSGGALVLIARRHARTAPRRAPDHHRSRSAI